MRFVLLVLCVLLAGCSVGEYHRLPGLVIEVSLDCDGLDGFWIPAGEDYPSYICTSNAVEVLIHELHHELRFRAGLDPKLRQNETVINSESGRQLWHDALMEESP